MEKCCRTGFAIVSWFILVDFIKVFLLEIKFWNRWCDYPNLVLLKSKRECCCAQQSGNKAHP